MDNLHHGTDTMTIISKPNPKHDTTTEYNFDPKKVDFQVMAVSIKGVEHDHITSTGCCCAVTKLN